MTGPVTALDVATYIRDNAMRLVDANQAGYFTLSIGCAGRFTSSYMDGFAVTFALADGDSSELITADTMENCVIECIRRRAVKAQQSPIKIPYYSAQALLEAPKAEDDDGIPF